MSSRLLPILTPLEKQLADALMGVLRYWTPWPGSKGEMDANRAAIDALREAKQL